MAVVVFDPAAFKLAFPEFAGVPDARLTAVFGMACGILDNTDASIVVDVGQRSTMLNLLVAHILTLYGYTLDDGTVVPGTGVVGRVASATEGSVSTSLAYHQADTASEAWYTQTQFGAMYWMMSAQYRSFRYMPIGRSGAGRALDFLSRRLPPSADPNSGTPGGA